MTIYGWVNAQGEEVLVICRHHPRAYICAPWDLRAICIIDWHGREDARGANFVFDGACLVKNPSENVLIVGDGASHLYHQFAISHNGCGVVPVVHMLMLDSVVLLVHADHILQQDWITPRVCPITIEILDVAKAVAA